MAAYGIIANIALVAACLCTGIAQGVQPLLSRSYGKSDLPEMKKLLRMTICTALGFAAVLYGVLFGFTEPIVRLFNSTGNSTLQAMAETGTRIYLWRSVLLGSILQRPPFSQR